MLALQPSARNLLTQAIRAFRNPRPVATTVWVFRSNASVFGWNSPGGSINLDIGNGNSISQKVPTQLQANDIGSNVDQEGKSRIFLDGKFQKTTPSTPIAIAKATEKDKSCFIADTVRILPRSRYGINNDSTIIDLADAKTWWNPTADTTTPSASLPDGFFGIQNTKVYCDAEFIERAEVVISDESPIVSTESASSIELNGYHPELVAGNLVALRGVSVSEIDDGDIQLSTSENDVPVTAEVVRLTYVYHSYDPNLANDPYRTTIMLEQPFKSKYWRDTVEICANVVEATHGETVSEVLGSGDARKPFQKLPLRRAPLTRLPAPTPDGKQDQLEVIVNNTRWDKVGQLINSDANNEVYELTGNRYDASTTVQFGNGVHGARLPTGVENVKALYRVGLGIAGNVESGQINQLPSPPFGVKGVNNPLRSDGGADPDSIAQTKVRIPALASTMRELVSIEDYKNFALLFAGIDKVSIENQSGQLIMYVAGNSPNPLSDQGALLLNLKLAFDQQGDDGSILRVKPHTGMLLHINARVSVDSRHEWEPIQAKIEDALLSRFGYPAARLGQHILASDIVKTIQSVDKVNYVVLNKLLGLVSDPNQPTGDSRRSSSSADTSIIADEVEVFINEICYIDERVASTVQLERIP
jgi:hypothetical protein